MPHLAPAIFAKTIGDDVAISTVQSCRHGLSHGHGWRSMSQAILAITGARWLCAVPVAASTCTAEIAALENKLKDALTNPADQPTGKQSLQAEQQRQPTPQSIREANIKAIETVQAILNRAKGLASENKLNECEAAVAEAKRYFVD
jgi:hypothetical protein